jgi:hypothetical protein
MKNFCTILFIFFISIVTANAQLQTLWERRYSDLNNFNVYFKDMITDKEGNVYITGYVKINAYNEDIVTFKYDYSGKLIWVKTYDGPAHREDEPNAITVDNEGNVIVVGYIGGTPGLQDFIAIKYDKNGDSVWVNRISFQNDTMSRARSVSVDDSNNVYIIGFYNKSSIGAGILVKYNKDGNVKWIKYYGINDTLGNDGNYLVVSKNKFIYLQFAIVSLGSVTCKYDLNGNQIWERFDSTGGIKIVIDKFDNVIVGGYYFNGIYNCDDLVMIKYDSSGNKLWKRTYNHSSYSNNDIAYDVAIDSNGNSFITGVSGQNEQMGWDYVTIKYNLFGDSVWVKRYNPVTSSDDWAFSVTTDKYGNAYVTGKSNLYNLGYGYTTIKYSPIGTQIWVKRYDGGFSYGNSEARKIIVDTNLNIYVSGNSDISGKTEIATVKYSQITGIQTISNYVPDNILLYQNFPNPFNYSTKIRYQISKTENRKWKIENSIVTLKVFDMLGKIVAILVNEKQNPGIYEINFNGYNLSTGIYYYRLFVEGYIIDTKKLILIK